MSRSNLLLVRQPIFLPLLSVYYYRRHPRAQPPRAPFRLQVFHSRDCVAARTLGAASAHGPCAQLTVVAALWHVQFQGEIHAAPIFSRHHHQQHAFITAFAEPPRLEERNLGPAISALGGACPEIRHRWFCSPARIPRILQIQRIELSVEILHGHLSVRVRFQELRRACPETSWWQRWNGATALGPDRLELRIGRVTRGKLPARSRQHPSPPCAQVPGEVGVGFRGVNIKRGLLLRCPFAVPETCEVRPQVAPFLDPLRFQEHLDEIAIPQGKGRERAGLPGHQARIVQGASQDEPRHGVDIGGGDFASEPHGFKGNGSAAREWIEYPRCPPPECLADLFSKPRQFGRRLTPPMENATNRLFLLPPLAHLLDRGAGDPLKEFLPSITTRIVEQRREQYRPAGCKGPPGRPDVQRGDVAMPNVLLMDRVDGRLPQRKRGLDQPAGIASITQRKPPWVGRSSAT